MNCNICGTIIPQGAAFCPECGAPVTTSEPPNTGQPPTGGATLTMPAAMTQSAFFRVSSSFINAMEDSGFLRKPLLWLYMFFALLNIIVPVYALFMIINKRLLDVVGVGILVMWLVIACAGWMGFQLWWNRKDKITRYYQPGDDFYAIPLFSHYIQTTGEWFGMTIAIVGAGASLVTFLFLSGNNAGQGLGIPHPFEEMGVAGIIASPILGFTIILFTKVLAELYRALAAIANNTRHINFKR